MSSPTQPHRLVRRIAVAVTICLGTAMAASPAGRLHAATSASAAAPGILRGVRAGQAIAASLFSFNCNAQLNADATVNHQKVPAKSAVDASTGCGSASLAIDAPGAATFQATYGVADDSVSNDPARLRVIVVDANGSDIRQTEFAARKGVPMTIAVDVSNAVGIVLHFLSTPHTELWNARLGGTAQALARTPAPALVPAGGTAIAHPGQDCNVSAASGPQHVSGVTLPAAGSYVLTSCGGLVFPVAGRPHSSALLYYGVDDASQGESMNITVSALDRSGALLAKAVGSAYLGSGLRPIWVPLDGAATVAIKVDGQSTNTNVIVAGLATAPLDLPVFVYPEQVIHGSAAGTVVDPASFVSQCNAEVGTDDVKVGGLPVFARTYITTESCGTTSVVLCCTTAVGTLSGRFGINDNEAGSAPTDMRVLVKDKDDHVLRRLSVTAAAGAVGTPFSIDLSRASVLSFSFDGSDGILYNLRLHGGATIAQTIYPPSVPERDPLGGKTVAPADFTTDCNASVVQDDTRMVGASIVGGTGLTGDGCGTATLPARYFGPLRTFYARFALPIDESPGTHVTMRLSVLAASGKTIRQQSVVVKYGYGPQPLRIDLTGGAALRIAWDKSYTGTSVIVYALTVR